MTGKLSHFFLNRGLIMGLSTMNLRRVFFVSFFAFLFSFRAWANFANIKPEVEAIDGGMRVKVNFTGYSGNLPVVLILQGMARTAGNDYAMVQLKVLEDHVGMGNQAAFQKTYDINYAELNKSLADQGAPGLQVRPGAKLYVIGLFQLRQGSYHMWGGNSRGGEIIAPGQMAAANGSNISVVRPTVLDLAVNIDRTLTTQFNSNNQGLLEGGQIRSRLEAEGKYQIAEHEFNTTVDRLMQLSNDKALASQVLGPEWTIKLMDRYLERNPDGSLKVGADNRPIPDPMVDTYYDNKDRDAAKKDIAIRYRYTAGNNSGAWNLKPGIGIVYADGTVFRIEYGLDTTDNRPESIRAFADSDHFYNLFKTVKTAIPGAKPSDFLNPSVEIVDYRYKFILTHQTGVAIEVSADRVIAQDLRDPSRAKATYWQLEMDIDHLATQSKNVISATPPSHAPGQFRIVRESGFRGEGEKILDYVKTQPSPFLFGNDAGITVLTDLHNASDLAPESAVRRVHEGDFSISRQVMTKLRAHALPNSMIPGAQKYAYAALKLGVVAEREASESVKSTLKTAGTCGRMGL